MNKLAPPPRTRTLFEAFSWVEFPRLLLNSPDLLSQPRGNGGRVLVFPGFGAGDYSTAPLRQYLSYLGHSASGWQLGTNNGDVRNLLLALTQRVEAESRQLGEKVALVGWSLGGYLAREVARELPHAVSQVITMGSPVIGGPKYTLVARAFQDRGEDLDMIEQAVAYRERVPLRVPVTAIYSRLDGVVAWEACIDHKSDCVEHIEIRSSHIGLGFSPDVYRILADRLAASRPAPGR